MFEEIHQSYFVDNNGLTPIKCVKVAKDVGRQKIYFVNKKFQSKLRKRFETLHKNSYIFDFPIRYLKSPRKYHSLQVMLIYSHYSVRIERKTIPTDLIHYKIKIFLPLP